MTDLSTLTATALNERIHRLMGHEKCPCGWDCARWMIDGYPQYFCPDYAESLDALKAGPEKVLREAGWLIEVNSFADGEWEVEWFRPEPLGLVHIVAPTEERARTEAATLGLETSK